MASSDPNQRLQDYMQGYEANFVPPLERKYVCPICLAALREAVQTTCGHRFCSGCLTALINGHVYLKCPVDNKWLYADAEVFPDVAMRREVLSLFVRCDNHSLGCPWTGELRERDSHVNVCTFILTPCSNDCGEMVNTDHLTDHLQVCTKRLVLCQHCETQVVYSDMTKHQVLICTKFPVKCTLCGKMGINREDIPEHVDSEKGDCPLSVVDCKYHDVGCTARMARQKMPVHYREESDLHLRLAMTVVRKKYESLYLLLESSRPTASLMMNSLTDQSMLMAALQTIQSKGSLYWRLDLDEGSEGRLQSPAFFTSFPGYKVCVSLDMEGYTDSEEGITHTYFCLELQPGDFDQSLAFPLSGLCHVTLFNHSEGSVSQNNFSTTFNCTDLQRCYGGENSVYSSKFLPKDDIFKYCRNRVLYFDVSFTPLRSGAFLELNTTV